MRKASIAAAAMAVTFAPFGGAQASGGGGGGGAGDVHLVPMDEVVVPIIEADRLAGALRFKLVLDGGSDAEAAKITASLPQLRAATVAAALEFARLNASALRAVDAEQLDHDLTAALKSAEPGLGRVLLVEVAATRS